MLLYMINRKFKNICGLILAGLLLSEVGIDIHQNTTWFNIPYTIYFLSYYLRAIFSLLCVFLGFFAIHFKLKNGYTFLILGIMFSILSISPPIVSLYFSRNIDLKYLNGENLKAFKYFIDFQKQFLINIGLIFVVFIVLFLLIIRKSNKEKTAT